jgi:predicted Zn-dependent protease with MMP-like domain
MMRPRPELRDLRQDTRAAGWNQRKAPSLEDFEAMAAAAFAELPEAFRNRCAGVVIHVEDFPDADVAREMQIESPYEVLGLFTGIGLSEDSAMPESGRLPNTVLLYRRPILDYWAEHDEPLGRIITHVLVHEIGHHFGLSDEDMDALEAAAEAAGE